FAQLEADAMTKTHDGEPRLADDILIGVGQIADFTGETERRTHYLLERRELPGFKIGGRWGSTKRASLAHNAPPMRQAATPPAPEPAKSSAAPRRRGRPPRARPAQDPRPAA